jgi:hypothetical protein
MKTVLYIDTYSKFGHTNLNNVFIQKFKQIGFQVKVVARKNYLTNINIPQSEVALAIPDKFYSPRAGKIKDRIEQWKILKLIFKSIPIEKFDYVFFSYFDEIAFSFSTFRGNLFLLNHSNVSGLENYFKRFFLKCTSQKGTFVVFHQTIKDQFNKFGFNNVIVEQLGLPEPYEVDLTSRQSFLNDIDIRFNSNLYQAKVFVPSVSKYQNDFFKKAISDKTFLKLLEAQNILLVLKDQTVKISHPNICIIHSYLSDEEYKAVFTTSDLIVLHYPTTFKYKVSALLFECFANKKPCLLYDIESFRVFGDHFAYNPFYNNLEEFCNITTNLIKHFKTNTFQLYLNLEILNPTLDNIK